MEGAQSMTNRELAIVGYLLQVLVKHGHYEELDKATSMMQGLEKPDNDKDN